MDQILFIQMSVKVAVRVRPFNSREQKLASQCVVDMQDATTILKPLNGEQQRKFTFDFSFWSFDGFETQPDGYMKATGSKYADQKIVFDKIGTKILDNAWQGYHCCLFAYGQTGSGKSYSMIGYGTNKGIVPITCNEIFERMKTSKQDGVDFEVSASMLEIYNEEVQDLTIPIKDRVAGGLKIRQNKLLGVYVDGVKKHQVTSFAEIENVMDMGTKNRTVAATQMNATSSRAHTIITIEFRQVKKVGETKSEKVSMINLVDLAGSQRQDKTGATGQRFKEAVGINQSLTCLGQVISILAKNADGGKEFVPYRNSVLTRILENALGGNSQTIMICAISPANDNYDESLSTLRYADQAKKIKNKPVVNESETDKLIRSLKQENERLKKVLEGKGQSLTNIQAETDPKKLEQIRLKQQEMKKKQEQFAKKQQEMKKKEAEQAEKMKKIEEDLFKKQLQKQEIEKKKKEQADALEQKLKAAQQNDVEYENLKKQIEAKKKEDQEKEKKFQEEKLVLEAKQKEQMKILEQQQIQLKKSQEEFKKLQEQMQKAKEAELQKIRLAEEEKKKNETANQTKVDEKGKNKKKDQKDGKKKQKGKDDKKEQSSSDSDDDEQSVEANIKKLDEALKQLKMNQQDVKKQAAKDQQEMKKKNQDDTILSKNDLKKLEEKNKALPPYFENISKDVMINRKMKLVIEKNVLHIGKAGCSPPNDIVFGGRDVNPRHATIHVIEQKVFLKPVAKDCHLYVNGKKVTTTIELVNLDRVIFGWNSCYLFKNKHDNRSDEKINDKDINWDFVRDEVEALVDIDQSDTEDGGCCSIF